MSDQDEMQLTVQRNDTASRYELLMNGQVVGIADFRPRSGNVYEFPHTEISPVFRGRGLGEVLVKASLDDVRSRGERIVPSCWFVADFVAANDAYADLVA